MHYNYLDSTYRVVPPQQRCLNHSFFLHNVVSDYCKSYIVSLYHARTVCHIVSSCSIGITYHSLRIRKRSFEEMQDVYLRGELNKVIFVFVDSLRIYSLRHRKVVLRGYMNESIVCVKNPNERGTNEWGLLTQTTSAYNLVPRTFYDVNYIILYISIVMQELGYIYTYIYTYI